MDFPVVARSVLATSSLLPWLTVVPNAWAKDDARAQTGAAPVQGWRPARDADGNGYWDAPAGFRLDGRAVARIVESNGHLSAVHQGDPPATLAGRLGMNEVEDEQGVATFLGEFDPHLAEHGWWETRTPFVRGHAGGGALHGCEYVEEFAGEPEVDSNGN